MQGIQLNNPLCYLSRHHSGVPRGGAFQHVGPPPSLQSIYELVPDIYVGVWMGASHFPCRFEETPLSPCRFKKRSCGPVDFRGYTHKGSEMTCYCPGTCTHYGKGDVSDLISIPQCMKYPFLAY